MPTFGDWHTEKKEEVLGRDLKYEVSYGEFDANNSERLVWGEEVIATRSGANLYVKSDYESFFTFCVEHQVDPRETRENRGLR